MLFFKLSSAVVIFWGSLIFSNGPVFFNAYKNVLICMKSDGKNNSFEPRIGQYKSRDANVKKPKPNTCTLVCEAHTLFTISIKKIVNSKT